MWLELSLHGNTVTAHCKAQLLPTSVSRYGAHPPPWTVRTVWVYSAVRYGTRGCGVRYGTRGGTNWWGLGHSANARRQPCTWRPPPPLIGTLTYTICRVVQLRMSAKSVYPDIRSGYDV
eukprot:128120-Chlamydomonas_euryale.AAC.1